MDECLELCNSLATSLESMKKLRLRLEVLSSDNEERTEKPKHRELSFITPRPLRSGIGFEDTGYRSSEGHLEDKCSGGENLEVTEPGMGSLTVTGPTGEENGTKGKLGAVATEDLIDFRAGNRLNRGFPDSEIGDLR